MNLFRIYLLLLFWGVVSHACTSPQQEVRFFVEGNCEACKKWIEAAALTEKGVSVAIWTLENSQLQITYNPRATDVEQIQQAVAAAGFATQFFPPNAQARQQLPECCREAVQRRLKSPIEEIH